MTFTVFTPTYNRAHTLQKVFQSLEKQTFRDFEWLIIDDGSSDGTQILVDSFISTAAFPIRYIFQQNQGKHIAINRGVHLASGELFLILDSDDACIPEALMVFKKYWDDIPWAQRKEFCGVTARCRTQNGEPIGENTIPNGGVCDVNALDLFYIHGISYELWGFICTDILKKHPFPEHIKNATVPEGIVWTQIAQTYKTRYVNDFLRLYFIENNHESLINFKGSIQKQNLKGVIFYYQQIFDAHLPYFFNAPLTILATYIHYVRFSLKEKVPFTEQVKPIRNVYGKCLYFLAFPVGFLMFLRDKFN